MGKRTHLIEKSRREWVANYENKENRDKGREEGVNICWL